MLSLAEVTICLPGDFRLSRAHGLDHDSRSPKKIIEPAAGDSISSSFNYNCRFHVTNSGDMSPVREFNFPRKSGSFRLPAQHGDNSRRIENHFGSPFSS